MSGSHALVQTLAGNLGTLSICVLCTALKFSKSNYLTLVRLLFFSFCLGGVLCVSQGISINAIVQEHVRGLIRAGPDTLSTCSVSLTGDLVLVVITIV